MIASKMYSPQRNLVLVLSYIIFLQGSVSVLRNSLPATRKFLPLPVADVVTSSSASKPFILRVLQFNVLADGLAALRPDLGRFNRASKAILEWDHRKSRILHEITQYEPDIITMQEVDHYYDFFLPELSARGYTGYFAPKPTSACLEVSKNEDGCAMFVKRNKLRVISCETKTLALSIAGLNTDGELVEDDKSIKAQSQVGLIAVCEICNWQPPPSNTTEKRIFTLDEYYDQDIQQEEEEERRRNSPPPIIISTTHLKSSKSYTGERYRQKGVMQILNDTDKIYTAMSAAGRTPAVVLLGCFNAVAQQCDYPPLTYRAVKGHRLGLRSVYNEDVPLSEMPLSSKQLYSTWKSRVKLDKEFVVKRSIDYIFYTPFIKGKKEKKEVKVVVDGEGKTAVAYSIQQVIITIILRVLVFFAWGLLPVTSLMSSTLDWSEKIVVISLSIIGLSVFEVASEGTVFKPEMAAPYSSIAPKFLAMSREKLAEKRYAETMIKARVGALSNYFRAKENEDGRPGLQCVAALDVFSDDEMGEVLIPSESYPSDHIAIASDLHLLW